MPCQEQEGDPSQFSRAPHSACISLRATTSPDERAMTGGGRRRADRKMRKMQKGRVERWRSGCRLPSSMIARTWAQVRIVCSNGLTEPEETKKFRINRSRVYYAFMNLLSHYHSIGSLRLSNSIVFHKLFFCFDQSILYASWSFHLDWLDYLVFCHTCRDLC